MSTSIDDIRLDRAKRLPWLLTRFVSLATNLTSTSTLTEEQLTSEMKQWERSRSPPEVNGHTHMLESDDEQAHLAGPRAINGRGHLRHSSEYNEDWAQ